MIWWCRAGHLAQACADPACPGPAHACAFISNDTHPRVRMSLSPFVQAMSAAVTAAACPNIASPCSSDAFIDEVEEPACSVFA